VYLMVISPSRCVSIRMNYLLQRAERGKPSNLGKNGFGQRNKSENASENDGRAVVQSTLFPECLSLFPHRPVDPHFVGDDLKTPMHQFPLLTVPFQR
jgi:hypothetical protein